MPSPAGGAPVPPGSAHGGRRGEIRCEPRGHPHAVRRPAAPARREFAAALAAGAAGGGLVLLAAAQPWARASLVTAARLPVARITVTGRELTPAGGALAVAALACLAAVIATRGLVRRAVGALLAAAGAVIAAGAVAAVRPAHVAAAAAAHSLGPLSGARPALTAFPWWAAAAAGGLVIVTVGALTTWRAARWPVMPGRYGRPGGPARPGDDPATTWDALDRGADPTVRADPAVRNGADDSQ